MSTPISKWRAACTLKLRAVFLLPIAILALSGCEGGFATSARQDVTVSRSAVTISGPSGFCVDPAATRDEGGQAFVLLGNCAALSGSNRMRQPEINALLTAAVLEGTGRPIADQLALVEEFLKSAEGRARLSRTNDPRTVKVLDSFARGDVLFLRARDSSEGYAPDMSPEYWRAIFDLKGSVVSVAVLGFEDAPLSSEVAFATVEDFARLIRTRNPDDG